MMPDIASELAALALRGVKLRLEEGRLRVLLSDRTLETEVRDLLSARGGEIARYLRSTAESGPDAAGADLGELDGSTDVSSGQRRLWFLQQQSPDSLAHHMPTSLKGIGWLDADAFEAALQAIVDRHEALRTCFRFDGVGLRCVPAAATALLSRHDLRAEPADRVPQRREALRLAFYNRPFDLSRDRMLRAQWVLVDDSTFDLEICIHHIAFDGWSAALFGPELEAEYRIRSGRQKGSGATATGSRYRAFARWQNQLLASPAFGTKLRYWEDRLAGHAGRSSLSVARGGASPPAPATRSRAGIAQYRIDRELTGQIVAYARETRSTNFIVLLAAFKSLLYRYSGDPDVCVGSASAYRTRPEFEGVIGFFVNALVLRTRVDAAQPFDAFAQRVRATALEAYEHQDVPFERIVEALNPERSGRDNPFFQVMFNYQSMAEGRLILDGVSLEARPPAVMEAALDLTVSCRELDGEIRLSALYDATRFDAGSIGRMFGHFATLLRHALSSRQTPVGELELLTADERHSLLVEWSGRRTPSPTPDPGDSSRQLLARFDAIAGSRPRAAALRSARGEVSFADLRELSNRVADGLTRLGVTAGDRVALQLPRGEGAIACMLASLRIGAVWVPLEIEHPAERHRALVVDAGCRVVVVDEAAGGSFSAAGVVPEVEVVTFASLANRVSQGPAAGIRAATGNDGSAGPLRSDALYLMYTSGSTGTPKGVVGSARSLLNRLDWMQAAYPLRDTDIVCHKTSLAFVDSVWEVFGPLLAGATSVVASPDDVRDPDRLLRLLSAFSVTHFVAVPSYLDLWCAEIESGSARPPALRLLVVSGEMLGSHLLGRLQAALPDCVLLNLYGSTEVTADATHLDVTDWRAAEKPPVGRPIAGALVYVLDDRLHPCPIGVGGEVCIGGAVLSNGYFGPPDSGAERFVPNPHGNGRMFRSGDLGHFDDSGRLHLTGRRDGQVKIRGQRVQPQEIETACQAVRGVRACCVEIFRDAGDSPYAVLFYTGSGPGNESLAPDSLRSALRLVLPEFMIPRFVLRLRSLPIAPGGKVDRARVLAEYLRERAASEPAGQPVEASAAGALSARETAMIDAWAQVLGHRDFGADDAFFNVGGHSLLGIRLLHLLRERFGVRLPVSALFDAPTPRAMAGLLPSGPDPVADDPDDAARAEVEAGSGVFQALSKTAGAGADHGAPVFLFPPNGTTAMYFQRLAADLDLDRRLLAMRGEIAWDEGSVGAVTDRVLERLLAEQPRGPYVLVAACLGAHFAYDVARRLAARDEAVRLFVIDAVSPSTAERQTVGETIPPGWLYRPRVMYRAVFEFGWRYVLHRLRLRWKSRRSPEVRWYMELLLRQTALLSGLQATPSRVDIVVIESEQLNREGAHTAGWQALAQGGFESIVIPGSSHYEVNSAQSRYSPAIAAMIRKRLPGDSQGDPADAP